VVSTLLVVNIVQAGGADALSPHEAVRLLNRENAVALDVRPASEFEHGHIINARHIPLAELKQRIGELDKLKGKPILVYCAAGTLSAQAVTDLRRAGFEHVARLKGGIAAWRAENLPLTQGK